MVTISVDPPPSSRMAFFTIQFLRHVVSHFVGGKALTAASAAAIRATITSLPSAVMPTGTGSQGVEGENRRHRIVRIVIGQLHRLAVLHNGIPAANGKIHISSILLDKAEIISFLSPT